MGVKSSQKNSLRDPLLRVLTLRRALLGADPRFNLEKCPRRQTQTPIVPRSRPSEPSLTEGVHMLWCVAGAVNT